MARVAADVVLLIHLVGFAALVGGTLVQIGDATKVVNAPMLVGALTQVVTGLALVGIAEGRHEPLDHTLLVVKLVVALVIALLCWGNRARPAIPRGVFGAVALLAIGDAAVAVFWS